MARDVFLDSTPPLTNCNCVIDGRIPVRVIKFERTGAPLNIAIFQGASRGGEGAGGGEVGTHRAIVVGFAALPN